MFSSFKIENDYIYVQLKGILSTEDQFNGFINGWMRCYNLRRPFCLVFDTREAKFTIENLKHSICLSKFISDLKYKKLQDPKLYGTLLYSIIISKSLATLILLRVLFAMQSPVAPVVIVDENINVLTVYLPRDIEP